MTETVTVTYPWRNGDWLPDTGTFMKGARQKTFTFADSVTNVSNVNFTGMKTSSGGNITARNTTSRINGGFSVRVYDDSGSIIAEKSMAVNKSTTKNISLVGNINLPSNSTVKSIAFRATTDNANIVVNHDSTSEFKLTYTRTSSISFTPYSSASGWISTESGSSFRIVQRVDNAYRKIANSTDVVVLNSLESSIIHGLTPGTSYVLVLQKFGNEWFDIAQNTVTTNQTGITDISSGSSYMTVTWEEDFPGALYTLTATSPEGSYLTAQTTELSSTITGLTQGTNYTVTISSEP